MSLTSMLRGTSEKDKEFQAILRYVIEPKPIFITASGKRAFSNEYETLVPYTLTNPHFATLCGTGFDYFARFIIGKNMEDVSKKLQTTHFLVAEVGLNFMADMTNKRTHSVLSCKYDRGIELFDQFINNKKIDMDEMCNYLGYFAALESIARSGLPPMDIRKSLVEDTNMEIINDLKNLGVLFEERFITSGLIKKDSSILLNPKFGIGSLSVGGADADIFIDGNLYDFKVTKKSGYSWSECAQILGYYILNVIDIRCNGTGMGIDKNGEAYEIDKISFYRARTGEIESLPINALDPEKLEQAVLKLMKIWGLNS